ncbi:MAG: hypothetical protein LBU32_19480 [Clostridiales bacterium]|nr:hypothetical protein [Clostridiales bacterium]
MTVKKISQLRLFSIAASIYVLLFLILNNILQTSFPWVLFCIPAFAIWMIASLLTRRMLSAPLAFTLTSAVAAYYAALNVFLAPNHPWSLYVIFALLWYPFTVWLAEKGALALSIFGFLWSAAFYITVNLITTPNVIWAIYPIFAVFWWPLSIFFFGRKRREKHEVTFIRSSEQLSSNR